MKAKPPLLYEDIQTQIATSVYADILARTTIVA